MIVSSHWQECTHNSAVGDAIALPARQVTNICFAGPDLDRMFVSSAAIGLDATPCDGGLFEVDCGVRGLQTHLFAG